MFYIIYLGLGHFMLPGCPANLLVFLFYALLHFVQINENDDDVRDSHSCTRLRTV